jgi:hypothetical protein
MLAELRASNGTRHDFSIFNPRDHISAYPVVRHYHLATSKPGSRGSVNRDASLRGSNLFLPPCYTFSFAALYEVYLPELCYVSWPNILWFLGTVSR